MIYFSFKDWFLLLSEGCVFFFIAREWQTLDKQQHIYYTFSLWLHNAWALLNIYVEVFKYWYWWNWNCNWFCLIWKGFVDGILALAEVWKWLKWKLKGFHLTSWCVCKSQQNYARMSLSPVHLKSTVPGCAQHISWKRPVKEKRRKLQRLWIIIIRSLKLVYPEEGRT